MMSTLYHHDVRTTLTLDEDVAVKLKAEVRRGGLTFKQAVNHFLRLGLASRRSTPKPQPFRVRARALGLRPGLDYDRISTLIERLEGPLGR
ncbi:MAG: DUF2191 domain-containing protein [Candidatus Rokubacteria bacterium]|nr:DUF2191 domain-containing protein [Candidatus Rokubacteria bacterium]